MSESHDRHTTKLDVEHFVDETNHGVCRVSNELRFDMEKLKSSDDER
jgi:hypothetical protein